MFLILKEKFASSFDVNSASVPAAVIAADTVLSRIESHRARRGNSRECEEERRQRTCKPGSVPKPKDLGDDHSSGAPVAGRLGATDPDDGAKTSPGHVIPWFPMTEDWPGRPYLVLLPVGFTMPPLLPGARCALTAPFHPCPSACRAEAWKRAGGLLSVALSLGSPPPDVIRHRVSVEPGLSSPPGHRKGRSSSPLTRR